MKFDRRLSERYEKQILENSVLRRFLWSPGGLGSVPSHPPVLLDAQIRLKDVVTVYSGTTKLLDLQLTAAGKLRSTAAPTYTKQSGPEVYGTFNVRALPAHIDAWYSHLGAVRVEEGWLKEGAWQAWLARRGFLGLNAPWAILDREAQPEGVDKSVETWLAAIRAPWQAAAAEAMPRQRNAIEFRDVGACPDFIAVLPSGDLGIVEVKHGSYGKGIYYGPIQVGGYTALWQKLLKDEAGTVANLNAMIAQRQMLGLLPAEFPAVCEKPKCVPILIVGAPKAASPVWGGDGLLGQVIQAASSAGAPLSDLQVWVVSAEDMRLKNVTRTLVP